MFVQISLFSSRRSTNGVNVPDYLTTPYSTVGVEAHGCEQLAQSRRTAAPRPGIDLTRDLLIASLTPYHCSTTPPAQRCQRIQYEFQTVKINVEGA